VADLSVRLGPIALRNPVMSASGTFGYGAELERFFDPGTLGAIVGKSITLEPRAGNAPPRMIETAAGMINSIGLQNPGIDRFLAELLPRMARYGPPVIVNVAGKSTEEFVELARRLDGAPGAAALELNLSCPNVKEGGLSFSADPRSCAATVAAVRRATRLPIFAKLTPNVSDVAAVARAAESAGADGLSLINTLLAMAVDWRRRTGLVTTLTGGLSGPAIKPIALRMVWEVARAVRIPVIGIGGIATAEDVLEFMVAGARAVQIGTATFVDPAAIPKAIAGLDRLLDAERIARVEDVVGTLRCG